MKPSARRKAGARCGRWAHGMHPECPRSVTNELIGPDGAFFQWYGHTTENKQGIVCKFVQLVCPKRARCFDFSEIPEKQSYDYDKDPLLLK